VTSRLRCSNSTSRSFSAKRICFLLCLTLAIAACALPWLHAQDTGPRKLVNRVNPKYPEYLKKHEIGGVVRLTVVVTANGTVKSVTPLGGNPILVDAATDAVKQWKYAPSDASDTFEVKLDFVPPSN